MTTLTFSITLHEPLLATALDGEANSLVSYPYLPGSFLRGALIGAYLCPKGTPPLDADDPAIRRLFFDGATRYLNAYPSPDGRARALPTPRSWFRAKAKAWPVHDLAVDDTQERTIEEPQAVRDPFCYPSPDGAFRALLLRPDRHVAVHIARSRTYGRPRREDGALFRYDALAAEQTFAAAIVARDPADADLLQGLLEQTSQLTVGAARNAGYGRARLHDVARVDQWRECGGALDPEIFDEMLTVTLLSPLLLRDDRGQYTADPDVLARVIAARLAPTSLRLRHAYLGADPVGGFNRTWGLPLPQAPAYRMGGVLVFDAPVSLSEAHEALKRLEDEGLGERRAEGFGRLAVNWLAEASWHEAQAPPRQAQQQIPPVQGSAGAEVAATIARRLLRRRLDTLLVAEGNRLAARIGGGAAGPRSSQLARLRRIVQDALTMEPAAGRHRLGEHLNALAERQASRRPFERATLQGQTLLAWVRGCVADRACRLFVEPGALENTVPSVAGVPATLDDVLVYEYNLRLVDGVLALAAKQARARDE